MNNLQIYAIEIDTITPHHEEKINRHLFKGPSITRADIETDEWDRRILYINNSAFSLGIIKSIKVICSSGKLELKTPDEYETLIDMFIENFS